MRFPFYLYRNWQRFLHISCHLDPEALRTLGTLSIAILNPYAASCLRVAVGMSLSPDLLPGCGLSLGLLRVAETWSSDLIGSAPGPNLPCFSVFPGN